MLKHLKLSAALRRDEDNQGVTLSKSLWKRKVWRVSDGRCFKGSP